jgi:hypothetical protein
MADYQIKLDTNNSYKVTSNFVTRYKVNQEKTVVAEFLSDLADVSVSDLPGKDQYVLTYDATLAKYVLIPADQILSSAAADSQLPADLTDVLDVDLDNRIDLDAGTF